MTRLPLALVVWAAACTAERPSVIEPIREIRPLALGLASRQVSSSHHRRTAPDSSSAAAQQPDTEQPAARQPRAVARAIADRVVPLVGRRSIRGVTREVPDDCSGLVRWAFLEEGVDLTATARRGDEGAVGAEFDVAERAGALFDGPPRPGDLVFFRETYDRNRDGVANDGLTHVGIVESVGGDGTVTFIHRANSGVRRSNLNLARPDVYRDEEGRVLNDFLRAAWRGQRARLTGELFAGFADSAQLLSALGPRGELRAEAPQHVVGRARAAEGRTRASTRSTGRLEPGSGSM